MDITRYKGFPRLKKKKCEHMLLQPNLQLLALHLPLHLQLPHLPRLHTLHLLCLTPTHLHHSHRGARA